MTNTETQPTTTPQNGAMTKALPLLAALALAGCGGTLPDPAVVTHDRAVAAYDRGVNAWNALPQATRSATTFEAWARANHYPADPPDTP